MINNRTELKNDDLVVINMVKEYPNYKGKIKWIIASDLSYKDLCEKYADILSMYSPHELVTMSYVQVRTEYYRNENKHLMRAIRSEDIYGFVDGECQLHNKELVQDDFLTDFIKKSDIEILYKGFDTLSEKQRKRLVQHFICGKSSRAIAKEEGVNYSAVDKSIESGLKALRLYFSKN